MDETGCEKSAVVSLLGGRSVWSREQRIGACSSIRSLLVVFLTPSRFVCFLFLRSTTPAFVMLIRAEFNVGTSRSAMLNHSLSSSPCSLRDSAPGRQQMEHSPTSPVRSS